jgi:hypothetical protein
MLQAMEYSAMDDQDAIIKASPAYFHALLDVDTDRLRELVLMNLANPTVMNEWQHTVQRILENTRLLRRSMFRAVEAEIRR